MRDRHAASPPAQATNSPPAHATNRIARAVGAVIVAVLSVETMLILLVSWRARRRATTRGRPARPASHHVPNAAVSADKRG